MWLGLTKRRLPVGYLTEYLENSVERLTIFGTHFFDSCSMTSELQRTLLGFNSLSSMVITLWTQGRKEGLIDLQFEQGFCPTLYILMMDVWLSNFFGTQTLHKIWLSKSAFSYCIMKCQVEAYVCAGTNLPPPAPASVFSGCPVLAGGAHGVKWWSS